MRCTAAYLGDAVKTYRIAVFTDERGALTPLEFSGLPFSPVRVFLVAAPAGAVRGEHAHKEGRQMLVRVSGEIDVVARLKSEVVSLRLNDQDNAVVITAPAWCRQTYLTEDARLLVLCETPYDPQAYIREP